MIDMNKQYTYKDKPVRIYADGSDCMHGMCHGAVIQEDGTWYAQAFEESDLVEVWEPKEGEIVLAWNMYSEMPHIVVYSCKNISRFDNYAPFKGELPEAFKGLV